MAAKRQNPGSRVWKFASCDGCQLSLLDCEDELLAVAGAVDIAYFPEATRGRDVEGRYDLSLVEGSITTPHDAERIREVRRRSTHAGHHRRLRHGRRHPGAAQLRRREGVHLGRLRPPRLHRDAGDLDADRRPRAGRFRAARLPDQQAPAARGRSPPSSPGASRSRRRTASASNASCKGNVCVMVAHGTPCLGPGDPCRLRRALPVLRPRLLRLLRAEGNAERAVAERPARASSAWTRRELQRVYRTFNANAAGLPRGERAPWRVRRSRSTISPASRAKARSRSWCATARSQRPS